MEILFYTPKLTNRIRYAAHLLLRDVLKLQPVFTESESEFSSRGDKPGISYTHKPVDSEFNITPSSLLLEQGITDQRIDVFEWEGMKVFFKVKNENIPFDVFAASFYLVSRYEEYLPHRRDLYNRFDAHQSVAYKNDFLDKAMVNAYAEELRNQLLKSNSKLIFPERRYSFIPTIDVDNAYAFQEKGIMRTLGAFARSFAQGDFDDVFQRTRVLLGKEHDPYDTFDYQLEMQKKYDLNPIYFFLVGDYGLNDKNVPITSRKFQSLIKGIYDYADVGIHPSFGSTTEPERLKMEVKRLSDVLHIEIRKSRQHFLKFSLPRTYRELIELEITDDYTMGYASELGFRASICDPFYFYDLDLENETQLKVHPFCIMEATLNFYLHVEPENASGFIKPIVDEVKKYKGTLMCLWHNDSLSEHKEWKGWKSVYEEMIKIALPQD